MEKETIGLKQFVALNPDIESRSICFGLFKPLYYKPTDSKLSSFGFYYDSQLREKLKDLFRIDENRLSEFAGKNAVLEQKMNGNLLLEGMVSADKQFLAIRLLQFSTIDYQLLEDVRYISGQTAVQVCRLIKV